MVYYKNVLLGLSNGLNRIRVSQKVNQYQDQDAQLLGMVSNPLTQVRAINGRGYYYFWECDVKPEMVQFLLNQNGVLAFRRYSKFLTACMGRRHLVRVPLSYVESHPMAQRFIDKIRSVQNSAVQYQDFDIKDAIAAVLVRMKQK